MKRKKIITVSVVFFGLVSLVTISALFKQSTALVSDAAAPPASDTSSLQIHPPAAGIVAEIKAGQKRNLLFGNYKWRVLDVQGDKALMITKDVIEKRPYNVQDTDVTWETCDLRKYLNGEFLQKFTEEERGKMFRNNNMLGIIVLNILSSDGGSISASIGSSPMICSL